MNDSIFKAYDIRGVYPTDLNEADIQDISKAIYTFLAKDLGKTELKVALGRDMRTSSPSLFEKAKEALLEMGATVVDVGLLSTPTFYFAVLDKNYDAGIQISASHNPKEYNGIKIVKNSGGKLLKIGKTTGMDEIKRLSKNGSFTLAGEKGTVEKYDNPVVDEVQAALNNIPLESKRRLKIVADPANAMGAVYLEELFKKIPADLVKINFELDGTFPAHQPDPLQFDTLDELRRKVVEERADLGIAPDGDGDRVFFIDEKGEVVPATLITSLIAREILTKTPGETVLVDIRYVGNVREVVKKYGGKMSVSKVGHALITEQLNREGAAFAGESSGHFYYRETGGAESSVRTILYLLEALEKEGKTVSELLTSLKTWEESGEHNFELKSSEQAVEILESVKKDYSDGTVSEMDGLTIEYSNYRFNIRTSNTEPLLRLNLEAKTREEMEKKLQEILQKLQDSGAVRK